MAAEGSYLQAAIDRAGPARPEVRRVNVPLGPVAVFGASNFPFGFGVLGHDSASALAAGCPVVVKAHPAHPRLSARLAEIASGAIDAVGGTTRPFGIIHGLSAGSQLVTHPAVRAVGFTGSQAGGLALWRLAAARQFRELVHAGHGAVLHQAWAAAGARGIGAGGSRVPGAGRGRAGGLPPACAPSTEDPSARSKEAPDDNDN